MTPDLAKVAAEGAIEWTTLVTLIADMSVVIVAAYIITRTQACVSEVLEGKPTLRNRVLLIVVFGCFSIYGTVAGVRVGDTVANTRDIGPAVAGLIGGPAIGLGAGLIGGLHRLAYGGDLTRIPCAIATVTIGLAAGLVHRRLHGRFIGVKGAVLFSLACELCHIGLVFLISRPFDEVAKAMAEVGPPMVVANLIGMAVFATLVQHIIREDQTRRERDHFLRETERIESELRVARDIQLDMVPKVFAPTPPRSEFDLYARLLPAREVGGDLYDFFLIDRNRLFFAVGDVSGKGVPAALFMAVCRTFMRGLAPEYDCPAKLLERVNAEMFKSNTELYFVTVFCGVLDLRTGEVVYTNAGHNPPILVTHPEGHGHGSGGAHVAEKLRLPKGIVLAVKPNAQYTAERVTLRPGDLILAYTDGITEAMNPAHEQFGEARLLEGAAECADRAPEEMTDALCEAVRDHAGAEPQSDDITVLVVRYFGNGATD